MSQGDIDLQDLNNEDSWRELYPVLQSIARRIVYAFGESLWRGQENDVAEDVTQETVQSLFVHLKKVQRGISPTIHSLKGLMVTIAQNKCRDIRRKDCRLVHVDADTCLQPPGTCASLLDIAIDTVDQEMQFRRVVGIIVQMPEKRRIALLIDLANRMYFGKEKTCLQQVFWEAGIDLREYRRELSTNPVERKRHFALLHLAYKDLKRCLADEKRRIVG